MRVEFQSKLNSNVSSVMQLHNSYLLQKPASVIKYIINEAFINES